MSSKLINLPITNLNPIERAPRKSVVNFQSADVYCHELCTLGIKQACLNLTAQGLRFSELADMLGISPRTVQLPLGNVRRKLQADNRAQMITGAMALKVIGI